MFLTFLNFSLLWCSGRQIVFVLSKFSSTSFAVKRLLKLWWNYILRMAFHTLPFSLERIITPGQDDSYNFFYSFRMKKTCFRFAICCHDCETKFGKLESVKITSHSNSSSSKYAFKEICFFSWQHNQHFRFCCFSWHNLGDSCIPSSRRILKCWQLKEEFWIVGSINQLRNCLQQKGVNFQ